MEVRHGPYRIKTDQYQYIFQCYKGESTDKEGRVRENWDTWGYYATLEILVKSVTERYMRVHDGDNAELIGDMLETLKPMLTALREARAALFEVIH